MPNTLSISSERRYDRGIVVFTDGLDDNNYHLPNQPGIYRLEASSIIYASNAKEGLRTLIVIAGGRCDGLFIPAYAQVYEEYLRNVLRVSNPNSNDEGIVNGRCVVTNKRSLNTIRDAKHGLEHMANAGLNEVLLITNEFQLERAMDCCNMFDYSVKVTGRSAEEIIIEYQPERAAEIRHFIESPETAKLYAYHARRRELMKMAFVPELLIAGAYCKALVNTARCLLGIGKYSKQLRRERKARIKQ